MERQQGIVVRWEPDRGFGLIESGPDTYLFHKTGMSPDSRFEDARPGQVVTFHAHLDLRGRHLAFDVRLAVTTAPATLAVLPTSRPTPIGTATVASSPSWNAGGFEAVAAAVRRLLEGLPAGRSVTVDQVVEDCGAQRKDVVQAMQLCEKAGIGRFIAGRRGHPSRFQKALSAFQHAAQATQAAGAMASRV